MPIHLKDLIKTCGGDFPSWAIERSILTISKASWVGIKNVKESKSQHKKGHMIFTWNPKPGEKNQEEKKNPL